MAAVILTLAGGAACASLPRGDGLRNAHLERLYFGRNIGDTGVVSDSAWAMFVREVITPAFPEGAPAHGHKRQGELLIACDWVMARIVL